MTEERPHRTYGVLLTFRRPDDLERSLRAIAEQGARFDELVVVDNEPSDQTRAIVERRRSDLGVTRYVGAPANLGAAGGRSLGARDLLTKGADDDWIVFLDDDDPLPTPDTLERLVASAERMLAADPRTAGVGLRGARLDRWTGRPVPVAGPGTPPVDHLHGNCLPCYRLGPLREVGPFDPRLFFGFEELELGLRLRRARFTLYADTELNAAVGTAMGHADPFARPRLRLDVPSLRRYYELRNLLVVLRRDGRHMQAVAWALVAGILKPVAWLAVHPRLAVTTLRLDFVAIRDAFAGRLGPRRWTDRSTVARP